MADYHGIARTSTQPAARWRSKAHPACDQNNPTIPVKARVRIVPRRIRLVNRRWENFIIIE
jgi:hypothetical protein